MNYYDSLNKLIDTIEENLENQIDYKALAKVIGTSSYTMQRIFAFLTGITVTEYIRKRRLSKSAEELKRTNQKIIDIAVKYQYDSPVSFTQAFKKMYGQSPASFRKSTEPIRFFPKMEFNLEVKGKNELTYRIVEKEEQIFYGKTTGIIADTDKKAIQNLYQTLRKDGTIDFMLNNRKGKECYYGIYEPIYKNGIYTKKGKYYVLSKTPKEDFIEVRLPKAKWACFSVPNKKQKNIVKIGKQIYTSWLPNSDYYLTEVYLEWEIYYEDSSEICITVE